MCAVWRFRALLVKLSQRAISQETQTKHDEHHVNGFYVYKPSCQDQCFLETTPSWTPNLICYITPPVELGYARSLAKKPLSTLDQYSLLNEHDVVPCLPNSGCIKLRMSTNVTLVLGIHQPYTSGWVTSCTSRIGSTPGTSSSPARASHACSSPLDELLSAKSGRSRGPGGLGRGTRSEQRWLRVECLVLFHPEGGGPQIGIQVCQVDECVDVSLMFDAIAVGIRQ